ncbi:MAG TPA: hypothetical protein VG498_10755 [Terriglobales bacterium]|nr:hypothetical protein [Terriglobales bacterium]
MLDKLLAQSPTISEISVVEFDSRVRTVRGFTRDEAPIADYLKDLSPATAEPQSWMQSIIR